MLSLAHALPYSHIAKSGADYHQFSLFLDIFSNVGLV